MNSQPNLIEARRIGRRAPGSSRWLIQDVSFQIGAGQRVAIVGPSGSGKTLLLRSVALLDPLDSGQILWQGRSVSHAAVPMYRSQVIYLHQRAPMIAGTVEENLRYPFSFRIHEQRAFEPERALDWLKQLGRDQSFLDKSSRDLSGGELQLASLLRAMLLDPMLLLLDEPTSAIDQETAQRVERLLRQWLAERADQRSIILVSHDRQQATRFGETILKIESGRMVKEN